ncbi:MAG: cytochrome c [Candidatus Promineifilaceae bacterium]|nr:cytochrome c [Candidatus Promineifilaceae bacterium]
MSLESVRVVMRWPLRAARRCAAGVPGRLGLLFVVALLGAACRGAMVDQPKVEPLEASDFFSGSQSARPLPPNAIPRNAVVDPGSFTTGMEDGAPVATVPVTLTQELLARGQEQYDVYCAPCHGLAGHGDGPVVQRGFPAPPSLHEERLRQAPAGRYFDVISNGLGAMFSYAGRVGPADRWAIIAYVRALQLSQGAAVEELAPEDVDQLPEEE